MTPDPVLVVNVTSEEYRAWKRAREWDALQDDGTLPRFMAERLGKEAWIAARKGGYIVRRPRERRIPSRSVPRVQELTPEEFKLLQYQIEQGEDPDGEGEEGPPEAPPGDA